MTIKVCHEKFDARMKVLERIFILFVTVGIPFLLIGAGIFVLLTWEEYMKSVVWLGIAFGLLILFMTQVGGRWIMEEPNIFSLINDKIKAFEWNEDC